MVGFIWANESLSKATGLSEGSFGWVAQDRQNANTLLAVVLLQAVLFAEARLPAGHACGLIGIGNGRGHGLVDMTTPPAAHKVERVEHVDHGVGINVAHQLDNVLTLVGRDNGVQQVHLFAAISADDLGAANAVLKMVYVGSHDLVCLTRRDLQRHAIVATIETVDGLGRNKLEHDGISRLVPAKHKAKDRQDKAVETKDDAPDGLARVVGNPQRDKVGAADEARAIADEHNVVLMDATTVLHMPLYQELRRRMDAGEFGRMNLAQLNFGSYKEYGDLTNRFYNRNLAGGAMLDIGVYALSVMRLFMASQPAEVVSLGNTCETGVDVAGGIVCRNAEQQLGVVSLTLHSKQPKRSVISFDKCYIEVNEYPRADHATIVWTADGHREEVHAGTEAYALCYEMADLEQAVAGDDSKRELLDYASDVMELMTKLRADWGVVYPEEE